jgi:quercetin dioxygenase-like cupin family protein
MLAKDGYQIAHVADIPWLDRKGVDGWPSRAGMYYDDRENNLCMRLIDYAHGLTEPRHVHSGSHAAVVLQGHALIDGFTLNPLDIILGPSNEPHGPLVYPKGVKIFSAFQGSYFHTEIEQNTGKSQYRLIHADQMLWQSTAVPGVQVKTLIDHGLGRLLMELFRFEAGATWPNPPVLAALVVEGEAVIDGEKLGVWDFSYLPAGAQRGAMKFPREALLLTATMR